MKFRRWKYITSAELQMKVTFTFIAISLMGSLASTFAFNFFALRKFEKLMWSTHISVKDTGELIRPLFIYINAANFLFVSLMLIIAIAWMVKIKSGPICRMNKDIKKISEGDLSVNIALRQKDEFQDVAAELNNMVGKTRERFSLIIDMYADISRSLPELKNMTERAGSGYDSVLRNIGELEVEIGKFKV
jgi:methyl-accepting chemotaxis protein